MKKVLIIVMILVVTCGVIAVGFQVWTKYQDHVKQMVEKEEEEKNKTYELMATQFLESLKQDIETKALTGNTEDLKKIQNNYEWTLSLNGKKPDCMDLIHIDGHFSGILFFDDVQLTLSDSEVIKVSEKNQQTYQACVSMW